jgi:hypothetical protein
MLCIAISLVVKEHYSLYQLKIGGASEIETESHDEYNTKPEKKACGKIIELGGDEGRIQTQVHLHFC